MTPEQYARVGQLFHAALDLPPAGRSAFLDTACRADGPLRRHVDALLAAHDDAGDFMATPAIDIAARSIASEEETSPLSGRVGAYQVLSPIGRGGMGEVFLAHDARLGRTVALKVLRSDVSRNPYAVRQFEQEARAASSLNHPNIVTIHEFGDFDDRRFLAMEYVEGRSLAALIGQPAGFRSIVQIGAQLARALAVAHAAGIVHRDVKPENVMVRDDGYVKVLDFGIAQLLSAPGSDCDPKTAAGARPNVILGTPRYMSPEQARGATATSASDVFSLGIVLYELATGTHPFGDESTRETLHDLISRPTPKPAHAVPGLPAALERLLLRMLASQASARPSADEAAAELTRLAAVPFERMPPDPWAGRSTHPRQHNLPPQRTPLIGRTDELAAVCRLLLDPRFRLLTLTGPGGTGKTRLAVQVASDLVDVFDGAVIFVDLAPIADPRLVASSIAVAVGVRESANHELLSAVSGHLRSLGPTLLLLDNFEQVSEAADLVRELLDACPALKVLVTSRLVLHLYGEQEYPVPPLPLPPDAASSPQTLMECASIALFVQRAAASRRDFTLTQKNAEAVVDICRRLDGLPLAIELAAARVKILSPAQLLARIGRRFELLIGGARDRPERQHTLRAAIKWSFDLLTPAEQTLFRRLSVFSGGCTLEGVEAVCNTCEDLGVGVLDGVASLVENSLLVQNASEDSEPRFVLLESFREYALERLADSGEQPVTQRAHAAYMLVLAEEETLEMSVAQREAWLQCCDAEHDNLRAAMQYLICSEEAEWALRLGGALFRFWEQRDHLTEGRDMLARVLSMPGAATPTRARARVLFGATVLADIQGGRSAATALSREACAIYRQFDDVNGIATTIVSMAVVAHRQGRYSEAMALFAEAVDLWQQLGDETAADRARSNMATAAQAEGNFDLARSLLDQVAETSGARGDAHGLASALNGLGDLLAAQGDRASARRYHHQSLTMYRQIDDRWGIARVLADLARMDLQAGDYPAADDSLRRALHAFRALGHQRGVARQLESLSWCALCQSRDQEAVALAGAAAAIRLKIGMPARDAEREQIDRTLATARARMSPEAYERAWRKGRTAPHERVTRR